MHTLKRLSLFILLALTAACASNAPPPAPTLTPALPMTGPVVDELEITFLPIFPLEIEVIIRGRLPNDCHQLGEANITHEGAQFMAALSSAQTVSDACSETPIPFEQTLAPDIANLPAGVYEIDVNGTKALFELTVDNVPVPTPITIVETFDAVISGIVWHDLCAVGGGDAPATPSEGCVLAETGVPRANGVLDPGEPGLGGILVALGEGACPSSGLATQTTTEDGRFSFEGLTRGAYCVSVEPLDAQNLHLLIPGDWTVPGPGLANYALSLNPGEQHTEANFGWDYELLPAPGDAVYPTTTPAPTNTPTPANTPAPGVPTPTLSPSPTMEPTPAPTSATPAACTDVATFVQDMTVEDDAEFQPGESFAKIWRLQNDGTCTWTTAYAIIFTSGDQMSAPDVVPLLIEVPPGGTLDISVEFTAPQDPGTYHSNWMLRASSGEVFGTGEDRDNAFWVQIVVPEE